MVLRSARSSDDGTTLNLPDSAIRVVTKSVSSRTTLGSNSASFSMVNTATTCLSASATDTGALIAKMTVSPARYRTGRRIRDRETTYEARPAPLGDTRRNLGCITMRSASDERLADTTQTGLALPSSRMGQLSAAKGAVTHACECGKKNGLPLAQLHKDLKCGKCKTVLGPPSAPMAVDKNTFDKIVKFAKVPVFVDFWAAWCGPCKQAAPEVDRLAQVAAGTVIVLKVDTEAEPELAARYAVKSIPNFMIFSGGKLVDQRMGMMPAAQMRSWLRDAC